jgi:hypothetical protein
MYRLSWDCRFESVKTIKGYRYKVSHPSQKAKDGAPLIRGGFRVGYPGKGLLL